MWIFENLTTNEEHSVSKQDAEISLLISENFTFFREVCCDEDVIIRYNNVDNAHCWAGNGQYFETIQHNTTLLSTLLHTRSHILMFSFDIFIYIYNVRGKIDQISTTTSIYNTCCAANAYIFVYICNGDLLVPLIQFDSDYIHRFHNVPMLICMFDLRRKKLTKSDLLFLSKPIH